MADAASLLAKLRDAHKKRALTEAKTLLAQIKVCAYSLCLLGLVPPCLCVTLGGCTAVSFEWCQPRPRGTGFVVLHVRAIEHRLLI